MKEIAFHGEKSLGHNVYSCLVDNVELPPGELNPNAIPCGRLCFEFMNTGK